jgi:hypothetical protein
VGGEGEWWWWVSFLFSVSSFFFLFFLFFENERGILDQKKPSHSQEGKKKITSIISQPQKTTCRLHRVCVFVVGCEPRTCRPLLVLACMARLATADCPRTVLVHGPDPTWVVDSACGFHFVTAILCNLRRAQQRERHAVGEKRTMPMGTDLGLRQA